MTEVRIPKLGLTMEECVLVAWLVQPGQSVAAGDPLFEIETDKIDDVVESPVAGTVAVLHAAAGDELPVGALVAEIRK